MTRDTQALYEKWLAQPNLDENVRRELENLSDPEEIEDRFYMDLSFGTAGLRGKLGAGTNRMNVHVVARAAYGVGRAILQSGGPRADQGVIVGYDCRIMSPEFASLTAEVLNGLGVKVYLFPSLRPTPEVSFAIRYYGAAAGINVTASHNPQEYNGYKVYWDDAAQIKGEVADQILEEINEVSVFKDFKRMPHQEAIEQGLLVMLGEEIDEAFLDATEKLLVFKEQARDLKIVYTPLNGAGNIPVREILQRTGFHDVEVVAEQEQPDGRFPTTPYPNPEDPKAFELAVALAKDVGAELVIATDPDCDRIACRVLHEGEYHPISGNELGFLFVNYLTKHKKMPANAAIVTSIVTSELGGKIAASRDVTMLTVLTGFKNICAPANAWEETGEHTFVMGYEESIGYSIGDHLRDKDGVGAALILAEMTDYYKKNGQTLVDILTDIYAEYGYDLDAPKSLVLEGADGKARIARMMKGIREVRPLEDAVEMVDYQAALAKDLATGETRPTGIEKTNCVRFTCADGSWCAIRPSGTEPKLKLYFYGKAATAEEAKAKLRDMDERVTEALMAIQ